MQEKLNLVRYSHLINEQLELMVCLGHLHEHTAFAFLFFFGHLWHATRALFKDLWTGLCVTIESLYYVEYGRNEKLGDSLTGSSKTSTFL